MASYIKEKGHTLWHVSRDNFLRTEHAHLRTMCGTIMAGKYTNKQLEFSEDEPGLAVRCRRRGCKEAWSEPNPAKAVVYYEP